MDHCYDKHNVTYRKSVQLFDPLFTDSYFVKKTKQNSWPCWVDVIKNIISIINGKMKGELLYKEIVFNIRISIQLSAKQQHIYNSTIVTNIVWKNKYQNKRNIPESPK